MSQESTEATMGKENEVAKKEKKNEDVPGPAAGKKIKKNMKLEFKIRSGVIKSEKDLDKTSEKSNAKEHDKGKKDAAEKICPEVFGVRSYLHNFYESVSIKNPQMYEDIYDDELLYMSHARKRRRATMCWRLSLCMGGITLVLGLVFLFVGYLTPHRNVVAGYQEDMEIIDRDANNFNYNIKLCRIVGLILFCSGGCIFCTALLLSVLSNVQYEDEDYHDVLEPFCVTIAPEEPPQTPTDKKVPVTEELTSVQPKRDAVEEVVMTNSGLCKPPALKSSPDQ